MAISGIQRPADDDRRSEPMTRRKDGFARLVFAASREIVVGRRKHWFEKHDYSSDTELPESFQEDRKFGFIARKGAEQVYVVVVETLQWTGNDHWNGLRSDHAPSGDSNRRFEVLRFVPIWRILKWFCTTVGSVSMILIGVLLSSYFGKGTPDKPTPSQIINMYSPNGTIIETSQASALGSMPSASTTAEGQSGSSPPASSSSGSQASGSMEATSYEAASPSRPDATIVSAIQGYLNKALGPYIAASHFTNVRLQLTQPLSYSPGLGTATCTIDGSIESDQRTLVHSNSYAGQASGAGDSTQLVEGACRDAINQMVETYKELNPS